MRTLLLSLLLIAGCPMLMQAQDAFGDLGQTKAVNSVCPIDGKPIDASLKPVPIIGQDGATVLVGADTQACLNLIQSKFSPETWDIAAAAKANTTVKLLKGGSAATTPAPTPAAPAAGSIGTASTASPAPLSSAPQATAFPTQAEPYPAMGSSGLAAPTSEAPAPKPAPKPHHHHTTASSGSSSSSLEYSDERQIAKKAAQRRDGDAQPEGGTAGESHHTSRHTRSTTHSTHTAPGSTHPRDTDSSLTPGPSSSLTPGYGASPGYSTSPSYGTTSPSYGTSPSPASGSTLSSPPALPQSSPGSSSPGASQDASGSTTFSSPAASPTGTSPTR